MQLNTNQEQQIKSDTNEFRSVQLVRFSPNSLSKTVPSVSSNFYDAMNGSFSRKTTEWSMVGYWVLLVTLAFLGSGPGAYALDQGSQGARVPRQQPTVYSVPFRGWPGGVVPYVFSDTFSEEEKRQTLDNLAYIMENSCIKFVPRTDQVSYMHFLTSSYDIGDDTSSTWEYSPQGRTIVITPPPIIRSMGKQVVMISLGFSPEHTRGDRDKYISLDCSQCDEAYRRRLQPRMFTTNDLKFPYDGLSITHLGTGEAQRMRAVMTARDPSVSFHGDETEFSEIDRRKIDYFYNCTTTADAQDTSAGGGGGADGARTGAAGGGMRETGGSGGTETGSGGRGEDGGADGYGNGGGARSGGGGGSGGGGARSLGGGAGSGGGAESGGGGNGSGIGESGNGGGGSGSGGGGARSLGGGAGSGGGGNGSGIGESGSGGGGSGSGGERDGSGERGRNGGEGGSGTGSVGSGTGGAGSGTGSTGGARGTGSGAGSAGEAAGHGLGGGGGEEGDTNNGDGSRGENGDEEDGDGRQTRGADIEGASAETVWNGDQYVTVTPTASPSTDPHLDQNMQLSAPVRGEASTLSAFRSFSIFSAALLYFVTSAVRQ